jgi:DNA-binding IscR family transcriptional regulator
LPVRFTDAGSAAGFARSSRVMRRVGDGNEPPDLLLAFICCALAANPGKVLRSEDVADSANTNPVVVRGLFSLMTTAGLIRARLGPGGGFELAAGERHHFARCLYCVGARRVLHRAQVAPKRILPISAHILSVLREATAPAVEALQEELSRATIADLPASCLPEARTSRSPKRNRLKQRPELSNIA